ncbi:hypothetical protein SS50377_25757 [Spironucleus salmonicida]|uniref:Uncharacterized protein n=1 Tax=Spironucleus salmonicida TaxID=348837 RepID=V6LX30_9EUKA|nr:hypothetical protein SS50377_25757 [Spironucleus salmonicida]|eukprot:EST48266.1 Hypothetical protein SS50377_11607 [Spironucleus salmonicida]
MMNCSFDSQVTPLAPTIYSEESYFDISDFEPMCSGEFSHYGEVAIIPKVITQKPSVEVTKISGLRFKQPKEGDIKITNENFISMMNSHSAIYSAFHFVNRKGLAVVPRNLLDILAHKTTNCTVLLNQEQKTLLWINDRKLNERLILVNSILEEPGLNVAWNSRLNAMKSQK